MTTETKKHDSKKTKADPNNLQPLKTFRRGAIAASVWPRQTATGFKYLEYSLSRSWKTKAGDKEGYSQNFFESNDEALYEVIHEASAFIRATTIEQHPMGEPDMSVHAKDELPEAA